jgi:hypothetical protein
MKARLVAFVRSDRSIWLIAICAALLFIAGTLVFRKPLDTREARNLDKVRHDIIGKTNRETETTIENDYRPNAGMTWGPTVTNTPICE